MDYMKEAINEAQFAKRAGEVPVGCVVVRDFKIAGRGHNLKETLKDPSAHAEVIAIRKACEKLSNWRLSGADLYVSLEPCPMCMSLITQSRVSRVFIGCPSLLNGACGTVTDMTKDIMSGYSPEIIWDIREEARELMESFFSERRKKDEGLGQKK